MDLTIITFNYEGSLDSIERLEIRRDIEGLKKSYSFANRLNFQSFGGGRQLFRR
jgi:hypothetical protein